MLSISLIVIAAPSFSHLQASSFIVNVSNDENKFSDENSWSANRDRGNSYNRRRSMERQFSPDRGDFREEQNNNTGGIWKSWSGFFTVFFILGIFILSIFSIAFLRRKL
jgi:hypothetical protein